MNSTLKYIEKSLCGYIPDEEIRDTALWIMEELSGLTRTEILCKDTTIIPNLEITLNRVRQGEPVQYIFGRTEWGGLKLKLSKETLIPRPETWGLVETLVDRLGDRKELKVLDVGTGSGCIAIALKKAKPQWGIHACDISKQALKTAAGNGRLNRVEVEWFCCDILNEATDNYDVIVSNPPYVMESEKETMQQRVLDYEPHRALFVADNDPLVFYRHMAEMKKAEYLFFEINERFGEDIKKLLTQTGYTDVQVLPDMFGKPRIVTARLINRD